MTIEFNFLQLIGGLIFGTASIIFSLWKIVDNMKKDISSKTEKITDEKHKQDINFIQNYNEYAEKIEMKLSKFRDNINKDMNEVWEDIECNKLGIKDVENKIDNVNDKYNSIIQVTKEIKEQLKDLYNKFNDLTKKIMELLEKK